MCTTDPGYYRWTQWIFLQLFRRGLAYQAEVPVNWCPALGTVLANEEVIDGKSERGSHPVVRLPMKQARPPDVRSLNGRGGAWLLVYPTMDSTYLAANASAVCCRAHEP